MSTPPQVAQLASRKTMINGATHVPNAPGRFLWPSRKHQWGWVTSPPLSNGPSRPQPNINCDARDSIRMLIWRCSCGGLPLVGSAPTRRVPPPPPPAPSTIDNLEAWPGAPDPLRRMSCARGDLLLRLARTSREQHIRTCDGRTIGSAMRACLGSQSMCAQPGAGGLGLVWQW